MFSSTSGTHKLAPFALKALKDSEVKQRRSNDDGDGNKKGKKNEAISKLPLASVSKRG